MSKIQATFIIPCLNEATVLPVFLPECKQVFAADLETDWQLVVVDNGSKDNSVQICKDLGVQVLQCPIKGYGATLNHGIINSTTKWVVYADADATYDPRDAIKLMHFAEQNAADLVLGSRMRGVIDPGGISIWSRLGTPVISLLIRILYWIPLTDCNSGIRCVRKSIYESLKIESTGMEFASELALKAAIHNIKFFELPANLRACPIPERQPHLRVVRDGLRHLKTILFFYPEFLKTRYAKFL